MREHCRRGMPVMLACVLMLRDSREVTEKSWCMTRACGSSASWLTDQLCGAKCLHRPDSGGLAVLAAAQEEHVTLTACLCHPAGAFCHDLHCWVFRDRSCLVIAHLAQSLAQWVPKLGPESHWSLQPVNNCMKEDFVGAIEPLALCGFVDSALTSLWKM